MAIAVFWVAGYERYYQISKDDYELYRTDKAGFYSKFALELGQKEPGCFSSCFVGADALRDYDGGKNFQNCFPGKENGNPLERACEMQLNDAGEPICYKYKNF